MGKIEETLKLFYAEQEDLEQALEDARQERAERRANRKTLERVDLRIIVHMDKHGKETGGVYLTPRKGLSDIDSGLDGYIRNHRATKKTIIDKLLKNLSKIDEVDTIRVCYHYEYPKTYTGTKLENNIKEF